MVDAPHEPCAVLKLWGFNNRLHENTATKKSPQRIESKKKWKTKENIRLSKS